MSVFNRSLPVIGMCHMLPFPGEPTYDSIGGINKIKKRVIREINALQNGGADAIIFSNEFSTPYNSNISKASVAAMSAIISSIYDYIKVPFGIDCMYDAKAAIDIAIAVNADFIRGILSGNYNTGINQIIINSSELLTHYSQLNQNKNLELWCSIYPEYIDLMRNQYSINLKTIIDRVCAEINPKAICLHSKTIEGYQNTLKDIKSYNIKIKIYADGGCNDNNINKLKKSIDGLIIGTHLKFEHQFYNEISENEVKIFISQLNRKDN